VTGGVLLEGGDDVLAGGVDGHLGHYLEGFGLEDPAAVPRVGCLGIDLEELVVESDWDVVAGVAAVGGEAGFQHSLLEDGLQSRLLLHC
jgi:hypothetical protein